MAQIACYFISGSPPCWSIMLALAAKGLPYAPRRLDNSKREHKSHVFSIHTSRGTNNGPEHYAYARMRSHEHSSPGPLRGLKRDIFEGPSQRVRCVEPPLSVLGHGPL